MVAALFTDMLGHQKMKYYLPMILKAQEVLNIHSKDQAYT